MVFIVVFLGYNGIVGLNFLLYLIKVYKKGFFKLVILYWFGSDLFKIFFDVGIEKRVVELRDGEVEKI